MFSCDIFENFKSNYFEEHLRTTATESLRKLVHCLHWENRCYTVNDTTEQQIFFIEIMNLMKLVCAIFTLYRMPFVITFKCQKRVKVMMKKILKYLEPPIVVEQF